MGPYKQLMRADPQMTNQRNAFVLDFVDLFTNYRVYNLQRPGTSLYPNMSREASNQSWRMLCWPFHILARTTKPTEKRILSDLPLELVEHVFSYLPLPSKVCLTISSKGFYQLFSHVLGANELRFPLMPRDSLKYVSSEAYRLRMTLLAQLENRSWACCGRCQKLHLRHEFHKDPLHYAPWVRACATYAGIMDLCPCVSLTVRDRARVIEHLEGGTVSQKRCLSHIKKGIMSLHDKDGERYISHICTVYPELESEIKLSLTESGQLISRAQYAGRADCVLRSESVLVCCSHVLSTESLIVTESLNVAESLDATPVHECPICHTRVQYLPHSTRNAIVAHVTRFLGRKDWFADSSQCACGGSGGLENGWYIQSRHPSEYIAEEMKIPTIGVFTGRCRCSLCTY